MGKFLFFDDCARAIVSNGVIPPIEDGDILWIAPILLILGVAVAAVTGVRDAAAVRAAVAHGQRKPDR